MQPQDRFDLPFHAGARGCPRLGLDQQPAFLVEEECHVTMPAARHPHADGRPVVNLFLSRQRQCETSLLERQKCSDPRGISSLLQLAKLGRRACPHVLLGCARGFNPPPLAIQHVDDAELLLVQFPVENGAKLLGALSRRLVGEEIHRRVLVAMKDPLGLHRNDRPLRQRGLSAVARMASSITARAAAPSSAPTAPTNSNHAQTTNPCNRIAPSLEVDLQ